LGRIVESLESWPGRIVGGIGITALLSALFIAAGGRLHLLLAGLVGLVPCAVLLVLCCRGSAWALSFYFGLCVCLSEARFRVRDMADVSLDWHVLMKIALWAGAFGIGLWHLPTSARTLFRGPSRYLLMYCVIGLISLAYSVSRAYSAVALFGLVASILITAAIVTRLGTGPLIVALGSALAAYAVASVLFYFFVPELGRSFTYPFLGFTVTRLAGLGNPNTVGRAAALLIGLLVLYYRNGRLTGGVAALAITPLALTLFLTLSRSSALALVVALTAVYLRKVAYVGLLLLLIVAVSLAFVYTNASLNVQETLLPLARTGDLDEIYTFTGRTFVWQFAAGQIAEAPWLGHGFGAFRALITAGFATTYWTTTHAHNMFLESLLGTGLIGTAFLVMVLLAQVRAMNRRFDPVIDYLFLFTLVIGIFEAGPISSLPTIMSFTWVVTVLARSADNDAPPDAEPSPAAEPADAGALAGHA